MFRGLNLNPQPHSDFIIVIWAGIGLAFPDSGRQKDNSGNRTAAGGELKRGEKEDMESPVKKMTTTLGLQGKSARFSDIRTFTSRAACVPFKVFCHCVM